MCEFFSLKRHPLEVIPTPFQGIVTQTPLLSFVLDFSRELSQLLSNKETVKHFFYVCTLEASYTW